MGIFDHFPYTNFHELNLDWILRMLKEIDTTIEQFVAINALKYADPIQWSITSQYEKNTIVIDPQTGTAYISVAPAPIGVSLSNTDYWTEVFNLGGFIVRAARNFANTYEAESTTTATTATPVNSWIVWGDVLYRATINISIGDSYVVGGNIEHFTMENIIGHIQDLSTTNKSNIVAAINEINTNLIAEIAARGNADTALNNAITAEATARGNADTALSNRLDTLEDTNVPNIWHNKNIVVYGDSLSTVTHQFWQYMQELDPTITITNRAVAGSRIDDGVTLLQNATDLSDFDIIVLQYGTNSWQGTSLKNMGVQFKTAIQTAATKAPLAQIVCIAPFYSYRPDYGVSTINTLGYGIYDYSALICYIASMYGAIAYNLYEISGVNQWNYTEYIEASPGGIYVHENERLGRRIANLLMQDTKYNGTIAPYYNIDLPNGGTLLFFKYPSFTIITGTGYCSVSDMEALSLTDLAGGYGTQCIVRGHTNKDTALCVFTASGTFAFNWSSGTPDTSIEGLQMIVFKGSYQPV